ncbi:MAG: NADPH-dependent F420 reductase [Chloroflexi bacterium]|nr:NADPH-dependent F420 reductase [Chloroflexota bacterium]
MTSSRPPTLGFIGGTGPEGAGLALRYASAGHRVLIGSRSSERATATAEGINQRLGQDLALPRDNAAAALESQVVLLAVPYVAQQETLPALAEKIGAKVVVSVVVPLAFQSGRPHPLAVPGGSAAQEAQALLPGARLVAAFHHLGAKHLTDLAHPLEGDVLVCGDDAEAKAVIMALVEELRDLRAVDAGGLDYAQPVEAMTAVLLSINRRYKAQSGLKITGLPSAGLPVRQAGSGHRPSAGSGHRPAGAGG